MPSAGGCKVLMNSCVHCFRPEGYPVSVFSGEISSSLSSFSTSSPAVPAFFPLGGTGGGSSLLFSAILCCAMLCFAMLCVPDVTFSGLNVTF